MKIEKIAVFNFYDLKKTARKILVDLVQNDDIDCVTKVAFDIIINVSAMVELGIGEAELIQKIIMARSANCDWILFRTGIRQISNVVSFENKSNELKSKEHFYFVVNPHENVERKEFVEEEFL